MIDNIEKIVERGDRLNLLVDKKATLHRNTIRFKRQARKYKNSVCWGNWKLAYVVEFNSSLDNKFNYSLYII